MINQRAVLAQTRQHGPLLAAEGFWVLFTQQEHSASDVQVDSHDSAAEGDEQAAAHPQGAVRGKAQSSSQAHKATTKIPALGCSKCRWAATGCKKCRSAQAEALQVILALHQTSSFLVCGYSSRDRHTTGNTY